ncbi:hypothetical protein [Streptomyces asoensis]|uniref:Uncharacterized protein n=1 Tax=Streptomyces asoensis TaxID=249586 RepID=A0ABQ3RW89_9ACTN|nr:hypothetical protein [Streptomyces asoensis]GGQ69459.1 hypothetical protein GCM10010496_36150 [Streptomyces asoensis]GHI60032.1 hypothetical protein Saso_16820 [Streptomyces asoensis]
MTSRHDRHTLRALGLADAPRDRPLSYPGAWPARSGLLSGDELLPLDRLTHPGRTPVVAVGSNASPAQLRHKMAAAAVASAVPMVKARVTGIDVGASAHVSRFGYVSASPVRAPAVTRELFVIWLDPEQLALVDATEPNYDRVLLPAPEFRVELENGEPLPDTFAYVNHHGVLHRGDGIPRRHPGQRALITELLLASAALRNMFGGTPEEFCARARADAALCEEGTRLFAEEKMVTSSGLEHLHVP